MHSLLLAEHPIADPHTVVEWFGAMQAQDVNSGLWSVGVRLPGATESDVTGAFDRRELIRTWPMRSTIHIVPATDARWMLALTGVRGLDLLRARRQALGLLPTDLDRALDAVAAALGGGRLLTRAELLAAVEASGIPTDGQRGYHLLLYASQSGLTCIGPQRGSSQTFALLDDWVPRSRSLTRDEALVELAHRYFRSHGPASMKDFAGWTGLTLTDARAGVAGNDGRLVRAGDGADARLLTTELAEAVGAGEFDVPGTVALPGYDEFVLGYKDRSLHGDDALLDRVVPGGNGVFRATIVDDGVVQATWSRQLTMSRVKVTVQPFGPWSRVRQASAERALADYARYLGRTLTVTVDTPA